MGTKERNYENLMGKARCEVCKKKCSGDILRADDKFFHITCFACKRCHRPLSEVGFFVHEGQYFCPNDYHNVYGKRCPVCSQFIEGEVIQFMDKSFHQNCFRCDRCKQRFPSGEKVTYTGREHLCHKCLNAPVSKVTPTQLSLEQERPISPPGVSSPTACAACNQLIHSGQVLLALDCQWHIWCFKCTCCGSVLHGEYMAKDGQPYCIRDYNAQFGVKCYECDKFIAGKVLQAGAYQFHPTCARCSRCGDPFADGAEMYMQGDEIWHPTCDDIKPPEKFVHGASRSPRSSYAPKYNVEFGKHLTYMYLIPEPNQGYLKQPISPHPVPAQQFHTPQGPVKIRRSRISILKTGMQKLTEQLEDVHPRPHSPHMDNEEPIEMAHYPGGIAPLAGTIPAIDRDDFPAPPFPYAVEDLKRRLSSSDLEDEDDENDGPQQGEKLHKAEEELKKYEKESSIIHVVVQNLEEQAKKQKLPVHWDPRSASRTPSAKKLPHLRCRYESPINASPSRYVNRPRPWEYWEQNKSATTTIPYFQSPKPGYGLAPKSATLPVSNGYYDTLHHLDVDLDTTRSSMYSTGTLTSAGTAATMGGGGSHVYQMPSHGAAQLRSSLPDMSKPPKIYTYEELTTANKKLPEDIDRCHLERHLAKEEFDKLFHMTPIEFYKLPDWKRINLKRKLKLF